MCREAVFTGGTVGIISGKNNEPTTVVMICTFIAAKDGLVSASRMDDLF